LHSGIAFQREQRVGAVQTVESAEPVRHRVLHLSIEIQLDVMDTFRSALATNTADEWATRP
jgi:hypothetical protein